MKPTFRPRQGMAAFTLSELLVAMGIASLLLLTLLGLTGHGSHGCRQVMRQVHSLSDTRATLHFLARDVSTRVPRTRWWRVGVPGAAREPRHDKLAFFRVLDPPERQLDPDGGDVSLVVWAIEWTDDRPGQSSPKLFRKRLPTKASHDLLKHAPDLTELPAVDPATDELLAYHVVSFHTRLWRRTTTGELVEWNPADTDDPVALDVELALVDDTAAACLHDTADWSGESTIGARLVGSETAPDSSEALRRAAIRIPLDGK